MPALILFLVAFGLIVFVGHESKSPPGGSPPIAVLGISLPGDVIARFSPLVYLHPAEAYRPMEADRFIQESRLLWRGDGEVTPLHKVDPIRLGQACVAQRPGCYSYGKYRTVDLTRPHDEHELRASTKNEGFNLDLDDKARLGTGSSVPVYYEARRAVDGSFSITYWFFYGFNRARGRFNVEVPFSHEGDWEAIDVVLTPLMTPDRVGYHQHHGTEVAAWSDVCKADDLGREDCSAPDGHPVVYSARGSHASYTSPGKHKDCNVFFLCLTDYAARGAMWKSWQSGLVEARAQPWYGFGGAWGHAGATGDTTGPLGPSLYKICPPLSSFAGVDSDCVASPQLGSSLTGR
jgi:hypothetical protein